MVVLLLTKKFFRVYYVLLPINIMIEQGPKPQSQDQINLLKLAIEVHEGALHRVTSRGGIKSVTLLEGDGSLTEIRVTKGSRKSLARLVEIMSQLGPDSYSSRT